VSLGPLAIVSIAKNRAELGAGWRKTSDRGNDYLSLVLDDPSFAAPVYAALVRTDEADMHRLVWNRRRRDTA
jgi:uncharacterized protein (DUF736 family)